MKQIITGPMGRVIYHDATTSMRGQYPALNLPCCAFSKAENVTAANGFWGPDVIVLPVKLRSRYVETLCDAPVEG